MERQAAIFNKIILTSGHLTDKPGRPVPRFPETKVPGVRACIDQQFDSWKLGPGDLVIGGGARGGDILMAESAIARAAEVWIFMSLPQEEFIEQSVRLPGTDWELRFLSLQASPGVKTFRLHETRTALPPGTSPFAATNEWMIEAALQEWSDPLHLYALLVWDCQPSGDGPGGTVDFEYRVRKQGGTVAIIDPTSL